MHSKDVPNDIPFDIQKMSQTISLWYPEDIPSDRDIFRAFFVTLNYYRTKKIFER